MGNTGREAQLQNKGFKKKLHDKEEGDSCAMIKIILILREQIILF